MRSRYRDEGQSMAALFPASHVIVVGGGLAGMVAANQILERGGRVLVLEKSL